MQDAAGRGIASRTLLLTGVPGVGKTTVVRKVADILEGSREGTRIAGFYTGEIRESGVRQGFWLTTFDGKEEVLAHVDFSKTHRVGKYGVDVAMLDSIADETLAIDASVDLYLVDEIGKMECFSGQFVSAMRRLLDARVPAVVTIARRGGGFIEEVKSRNDVELWEVTRANRDELPAAVADWFERATQSITVDEARDVGST